MASRASRTAEFMALFRALESAHPPAHRLFEDPFARSFLGPSLRLVTDLARVPVVGRLVPWALDLGWRGARTSGVARTRFIDDALTAALGADPGQVVLVGAGFDARAYRLPALARERVYEVDRPATLAAKRSSLSARGPLPARVAFVEADLDRQSLPEVLRLAGFDASRPACFVWEGVTNYLTEAAVDATLSALGATAAGGTVIFTYVHRAALAGDRAFAGAARMRRAVRRFGEPWTFGFNPADLPAYLLARGLVLLEDVGAADYRARYWGKRAVNLRGYEFYRIARARVVGAKVEGPDAQG